MENLSNKRWKQLIAETNNHVVLDVRTPDGLAVFQKLLRLTGVI